jgi:hypothetical protein
LAFVLVAAPLGEANPAVTRRALPTAVMAIESQSFLDNVVAPF